MGHAHSFSVGWFKKKKKNEEVLLIVSMRRMRGLASWSWNRFETVSVSEGEELELLLLTPGGGANGFGLCYFIVQRSFEKSTAFISLFSSL